MQRLEDAQEDVLRQILGLIVLTLATFVAFVVVQRRVAEPIMPLRVFGNLNFNLSGGLAFISGFAMFGAVIFETLAVTTIFVFRRRLPDVPRPYRCPGYPWVPLLSLTLPIFVLGMMFVNQPYEALFGVAFVAAGAAAYAISAPSPPAGDRGMPCGI